MDTSNLIKIRIPKPCHEDWNKMTPNEQGSFCSKCCKTVIDFTNRSMEEIKNTLLEHGNKKVCGRFMSEQLVEVPKSKPNFNFTFPLYKLPSTISYKRAFAIALFIAFYATLFSCDAQQGKPVGEIVIGKTAKPASELIDTTKKSTEILGDTILKKQPQPIMGGARYCEPVKGDVAVEPVKATIIASDTTKTEVKIKGKKKVKKESKPKEMKIYVGHDPG